MYYTMEHFSKDGRTFIVKTPNEEDAKAIIEYARVVFASTDQLLNTPEEYTITEIEEKLWIRGFLTNGNSLIQVAELEARIAGLLYFVPQPKRKTAHTGEFGVSVHPDFQGVGIGRALVKTLLQWAKKNSQIEKVFLNVLDTNSNAIKLYRDLGFREEGRLVKAIKQPTGDYVDVIQMYIET